MRKGAAFLFLLFSLLVSPGQRAAGQSETPGPEPAPMDIINAYNSARVAKGYKPLKIHSILMSTAQQTAEIMAANNMTGHIGDVRGRVWTAGYGDGDTPWATENFLMGPMPLDGIMMAWGDSEHSIPILNPNYCDIGVGIAEAANGTVYYVLHAAYTDYHFCGDYKSPTPGKGTPSAIPGTVVNPMSELIWAVQTVTPQTNGWAIHTVLQGQSLWSIAMAYRVKGAAIIDANAFSSDDPTIYAGQKLFIPVPVVASTVTPLATRTSQAGITTAAVPSPDVRGSEANTHETSVTNRAPLKAKRAGDPDHTLAIAIAAAFGLGCAVVMLGIGLKKN